MNSLVSSRNGQRWECGMSGMETGERWNIGNENIGYNWIQPLLILAYHV